MTLLDCSPAWVTQPPATCSTWSGAEPGPLHQRASARRRGSRPGAGRPARRRACRSASAPPRRSPQCPPQPSVLAAQGRCRTSHRTRTCSLFWHGRPFTETMAAWLNRLEHVTAEAVEAVMAEPNIPAGLRLHRSRPVRCSGCPPRSSPSCGAPRRSGGTPSRAAPPASTTRATGWSPGTPTCWRSPRAAAMLLQRGEDRDHPARAAGDRGIARAAAAHPAQHRPARSTPSCAASSPAGFTPRAIGNLREALTARAERIVQTALAEGTGDFVTDVACELPLQAIAELLGIPQEDRRQDLRLVEPDDRLRRPRVRGRLHWPPRPSWSATAWSWPRTASSARATTSSPSWSTPRSTATTCPPTSSASS